MKVIRHHDPAAFSDRVLPLLVRDEAVNNWMVGLATDLCGGARAVAREQLLLLEIQDSQGRTTGAAASTGEALVLTKMDGNALIELATFLQAGEIALAKTAGPSGTVGPFAALRAERTGSQAVASMQLTIMHLEAVAALPPTGGALRLGGAMDAERVTPWAHGFSTELGLDLGNPERDVRRRIELKRLYLWCDPEPVSMAATAGPTPNGIRINFVYTPPEFRRRGYARACVSTLSQAMLDSGKKFVFLFVDANNPGTNRLYREIGYRPVCDWEDWRFEPRNDNSRGIQ